VVSEEKIDSKRFAFVQFKTDCQFWRGDKPCVQNRLCDDCQAYTQLGPRILLIKLGARGDVLRTTPLLAGLKKKYSQAHITWLTSMESLEILSGVTTIDRLMAWDANNLIEIQARTFDIVICLDKEPHATGLAKLVQAKQKMGWGLAANGVGAPDILNPEAAYSLALGVSDDLKFGQDQKTYMEIIFGIVGLTYAQEPYVLELSQQDRACAQTFLKNQNHAPDRPLLGLVTGCGPAFQRKRWIESGFAEIAKRAKKELQAEVVLLGGHEEVGINERIRSLAGERLLDSRGEHNLREFAGFIQACQVVITGDTLALHMALALKRPTICLFGPTCAQEIEMFGLGEKVVAPVPCVPCYRQTCEESPTCMESISVETVWSALMRLWRT
jgi:lipopolysaccharide heptosyltransferase III